MQPDDYMTNLLQGLVGAITPALTSITLNDNPMLSGNVSYGFLDPQDKSTNFPVVTFYDQITLPAEVPGLTQQRRFIYTPTSSTQGTLGSIIRYFHTMIDITIWTTNPDDRSIISSAIHSVLDVYPFNITLPNGSTAKPIFQKELRFPTEPERHLYRSCLTYLCKHHLLVSTTEYTFIQPNLTINLS